MFISSKIGARSFVIPKAFSELTLRLSNVFILPLKKPHISDRACAELRGPPFVDIDFDC